VVTVDSRSDGAVTVTALYRYPIKSCAGMALGVAEIGPRGIVHDREFMLVEPRSGLFFTQRELPRMALIRPSVVGDLVTLSAPEMAPFSAAISTEGPERDVVVWRDRCRAVDQGDAVAGWLSRFLGREVRLVRMAEAFLRRVNPDFAVDEDDQVGFQDGYPFLIISEESLADLNARLAEPLPMNRFRPNIVVRGGGPFAEDGWRRVRIGRVELHLVKACARCAITTTDQETAAVGREPLATLATFRRAERGVLFGQNAVHTAPGAICRGDPVEVLESSHAPPR
jgi:uncharacterized protein